MVVRPRRCQLGCDHNRADALLLAVYVRQRQHRDVPYIRQGKCMAEYPMTYHQAKRLSGLIDYEPEFNEAGGQVP